MEDTQFFANRYEMVYGKGVFFGDELDFNIAPVNNPVSFDWSAFRREAAKEILAGMVANKVYRAHPDDNDEDELKAQQRAAKRAAFTAIVYADALIEKFKQE